MNHISITFVEYYSIQIHQLTFKFFQLRSSEMKVIHCWWPQQRIDLCPEEKWLMYSLKTSITFLEYYSIQIYTTSNIQVLPALQKWEWFIFGDRSSRLTCVLKKSDRLPASANETFPLDLFAENSLRSQIHQNSETKTFAKNHKSPYFCLVSANVTFQQKQFSGYNKIEIKQ